MRYHNGPLGSSDFANALALDPSGNVIVVGYDRTRDPSSGKNYDEFVTIKYAPDGTELWIARRTEAQISDHAIDVAVDSAVNNGDRRGVPFDQGGWWRDATADAYPDWVEVAFAGEKTISEVDLFLVQDDYEHPSGPTESMTFSRYGLVDYDVQYLTGGSWVTLPGGEVRGNDKVWRKLTFAPVTTTKIRVVVHGALAGRSRLVEIEAY